MKPLPNRIAKGLYWDRALKLVEGCSYVSPGCDHCWSASEAHMRAEQKNEKIHAQYAGLTDKNGRWNGKIRLMEKNLDLPLRVKRPTVFSVWNDLFHEDVPDWFLDKAFKVFLSDDVAHHVIIVLTKRHERMLEYTSRPYIADILKNRSNIIGMVTAENQHWAEVRVPYILRSSFAVKGVSVEPMLGPVDLTNLRDKDGDILDALSGCYYSTDGSGACLDWPALNWVVCGGESGRGARPMHPNWARSLLKQCQAAAVKFLLKQWGEWGVVPFGIPIKGNPSIGCWRNREFSYGKHCNEQVYKGTINMIRVGKKAAGRLLDGRTWDEFPEAS